MPALQIRARFPLGVYRGHVGAGGLLSAAPETSRLFRALVHAAGTGSTAVVDGRHLRPSEESIEALRWLEAHPPVALVLPERAAINTGYGSYRAEGVFESSKKRRDRKVLKVQSDGVAVPQSGGWEWRWDDVPKDVADTIVRLAEDVSCLGEADSPVVLETSGSAPTHAVALGVGRLTPGPYTRVATPMPGHFDELEEAHRLGQSKRPPRKDTFGWGARPGAAPPPTERSREVAYRRIDAKEEPSSPWPFALHVPIEDPVGARTIREAESVRWCVAFHSALAARLGEDAPPIIIGNYPKGEQRPPNRVAVHLLREWAGAVGPGFLVLLPLGIEEEHVARLQRALASLRKVYIRKTRADDRQEARVGSSRLVSAESFWSSTESGHRRLWAPGPAIVPEVTRQTTSWTLADAALLSVGFLLRDQFDFGGGKDRYQNLVEQVSAAGVRAYRPRAVPSVKTEEFVHHMPQGVPVRPMTAFVDVAGLVPERALFALGQSRHLGGGLMHPIDLPEPLVSQWEEDHAGS